MQILDSVSGSSVYFVDWELSERVCVGVQGSLMVPCHLLTDPQDLPADVSEEYIYKHTLIMVD